MITILATFKDIVSVIFSICVILFITIFCIVDSLQTKCRRDQAKREREKRRNH